MSLTGTFFLGLVLVLTLLAIAGLVFFWPVLAGPDPVSVLLRTGSLIGVNVLVVLTVLSQLNAHYQFYANWSDLTGSLGHGPQVTASTGGSSAAQAAGPLATRGGSGVQPVDDHAPNPFPVGPGLHQWTLTGPISGVRARVWVDLPAGYDWHSARRYPVIETFPGYPGLPTQWDSPMRLPRDIALVVHEHRIRPAVVVEPETEVPGGVDTECVNGVPGEPQMETWLTTDVPAWADQHFQVETGRSGWVTMGLSTGAWCAAMATMLHPREYAAALLFGGYFRPEFSNYLPFAATSPQDARYDLLTLVRRRPPRVALWLMTSQADPVSYPSSSAVLRSARPPLAVVSVVLRDAGHRTSVWAPELPAALTWLGRTVPGFDPARASVTPPLLAEPKGPPRINRVG